MARLPRFIFLLPVIAALITLPAPAQETRPIQDNSFLVEEAYNQEGGVIQHISTLTRFWSSGDWAYTFTQEWPMRRRPRHQLSYSLAVLSPGGTPQTGTGFGDVMLNYRYQLVGNGDTRLAFAPRLSLIAPTGSARLGRGFGGYGTQINLPLSAVIHPKLVTHWNLGTTLVPGARNAEGQRAMTTGYNFGQSVVWLARPRFNVLLESVFAASEAVIGQGKTQWNHTALISPGVRWAHNFKSGLQIVPGIGVPIGVGPSAGERGIFVYLSFEHPLHRREASASRD
jgi:hypothetical protein